MKNAGKREQNDACISYAEQERFRRSQKQERRYSSANLLSLPTQELEQDQH